MKRLFVDMDGVLADYESGLAQVDEATLKEYEGHSEQIPGLYSLLPPIEGAVKAMKKLSKHYDVYVLTTAPWRNPSAWTDKRVWITQYFRGLFYKKLIITHRKDFVVGDYLIDDRPNNGTSEFCGEWIQFGSEQFPDWESVLLYLSEKDGWQYNQ